MSFFKFWNKPKKSDDDSSFTSSGQEESSPPTSPKYTTGSYRRNSTGTSSDTSLPVSPHGDDEVKKSARKLSISRSGRYRAKKRERSIISDKPEVFQYPPNSPGSPGFDSSADWSSTDNDWTGRPSAAEHSSLIVQTPSSRSNTNSNCSTTRNVTEPISNFRITRPPNLPSQATAV